MPTQCQSLGIAFLPWLLRTDTTSWMLRYLPGVLLSLAGLALSIWAVWALGASFSIAPAVRGLVRRGPYGWMRHPMYTGELLTLIGVLSGVHSRFYWLQNSALVLLVLGGVIWRIGLEERLLQKYAAYAAYRQSVPWRMLPGV